MAPRSHKLVCPNLVRARISGDWSATKISDDIVLNDLVLSFVTALYESRSNVPCLSKLTAPSLNELHLELWYGSSRPGALLPAFQARSPIITKLMITGYRATEVPNYDITALFRRLRSWQNYKSTNAGPTLSKASSRPSCT
ncbi:hypothetical protein R3P38DRAFT_3289495 [Favolaschia claudopus]|uniref:Uncharacterized protein n=1 Tax=Favolaschia claudopus TaxID=2862362 RepID=A0AAV9ZUT4_9AGAR